MDAPVQAAELADRAGPAPSVDLDAWARTSALWPGADTDADPDADPNAMGRFVDLAAQFRARGDSGWVPELGALAVRLADWWVAAASGSAVGAGRVLGISGGQGTGKSTLVAHLAGALTKLGQRVAVISLDDLYLSQAVRRQLAAQVHPLLATRGVPGTHDLVSGGALLDALARPGDDEVALPRFDKAADDPAPAANWPRVRAPCDSVLLEGWCLGIAPQEAAALGAPCNALEANEDAQGHWRKFVNTQLAGPYAAFFARCERLVALLPPDFAAVRRWRGWQEQSLPADRRMDVPSLDRFVAHYERLTRHGILVLPQRADVVVRLAVDHHIAAIGWRGLADTNDPAGAQPADA